MKGKKVEMKYTEGGKREKGATLGGQWSDTYGGRVGALLIVQPLPRPTRIPIL